MERPASARRAAQIVEQVEEGGIDRVLLAGSVVPKEPAEPCQGLGNVVPVREIGNRDPIAGVSMEERKNAFLSVRERVRGRRERQRGKRREAAEESAPRWILWLVSGLVRSRLYGSV